MIASELIAQLTTAIEEHGDIEVAIHDTFFGYYECLSCCEGKVVVNESVNIYKDLDPFPCREFISITCEVFNGKA